MPIRLSRNFTLDELCASQTAARMGRKVEPTDEQIDNLRLLCGEVLQPVRDWLGVPVVVTSGLRPKWLNKTIGGSVKSQHINGFAADIIPVNYPGSLIECCKAIVQSDIEFDQMIFEFNEWIHISAVPENPRGEILTAYKSDGFNPKTIYEQGLHEVQI